MCHGVDAVEEYDKIIKQWEKEYKKGFVLYLILSLLLDKPMYGYQIISHLEEMTNNAISLKESGVYQVLKKLKQKKIINSFIKKSHLGPKRKYYSITEKGKKILIVFGENCVKPIHSVIGSFLEKNNKIVD